MELIDAIEWDDGSGSGGGYLDLETGEVLVTIPDTYSDYEAVCEAAEEEGISFEEALAKHDVHEWQKDGIAMHARIEDGLGETIIGLPEVDSRAGFEDMMDFTDTVKDAGLNDLLRFALDGPRPFRRFKDALGRDAKERERWFAFSAAQVRQRALDWLEEMEIELID